MSALIIWEAVLEAFLDSIKSLPFLFLAFWGLEALEKHSNQFVQKMLSGARIGGPAIGAGLGLIPQCGFSAALADLYAGGAITLGTMLAVFLATSDEAILILMSQPSTIGKVWPLLLSKLVIGIVAGYMVDIVIRLIRGRNAKEREVGDICTDCGCHNAEGTVKPAIIHTAKTFAWLLGISIVIEVLMELAGADAIASALGNGTWYQPLLTALFGLIPNCAVSVAFTELYIAGSLSFASTVAGLCSGAGVGLIVLFKVNPNKKQCFAIAFLLYAIAAVCGVALNIFT